MEEMHPNRDTAIDVSRGIAALLMIIGHLKLNNEVDQFIFSFHMPLFFILSGMTVHEEKEFFPYLKKRIRRLLVPYFIFALIFAEPEITNWSKCFFGTREGLLNAGSLSPLWFLPCLFSADVIFHLLLKFCREEKVLIIVSLLLAAVGIIIRRFLPFGIALPFSIDIAMVSIPFLLIGYLLKRHSEFMNKAKDNLVAGIIVAVGLVIILLFTYSRNLPPSAVDGIYHVEMATGCYGNIFWFYFNSIIGSFAVILFSLLMAGKLKVMERFGNCTITCLVSHWSILSLMNRIGAVINVNPVLFHVITVIVTVIAVFGIHHVLESYAPNLIGKTG